MTFEEAYQQTVETWKARAQGAEYVSGGCGICRWAGWAPSNPVCWTHCPVTTLYGSHCGDLHAMEKYFKARDDCDEELMAAKAQEIVEELARIKDKLFDIVQEEEKDGR